MPKTGAKKNGDTASAVAALAHQNLNRKGSPIFRTGGSKFTDGVLGAAYCLQCLRPGQAMQWIVVGGMTGGLQLHEGIGTILDLPGQALISDRLTGRPGIAMRQSGPCASCFGAAPSNGGGQDPIHRGTRSAMTGHGATPRLAITQSASTRSAPAASRLTRCNPILCGTRRLWDMLSATHRRRRCHAVTQSAPTRSVSAASPSTRRNPTLHETRRP